MGTKALIFCLSIVLCVSMWMLALGMRESVCSLQRQGHIQYPNHAYPVFTHEHQI